MDSCLNMALLDMDDKGTEINNDGGRQCKTLTVHIRLHFGSVSSELLLERLRWDLGTQDHGHPRGNTPGSSQTSTCICCSRESP